MSLDNKKIQTVLKAYQYYTGSIDGVLGTNSTKAIINVLNDNKHLLPLNYSGWALTRQAILAVQVLLKQYYTGTLDGYDGMLTQYAYDTWKTPEPPWRPDDNFDTPVNNNWGSQATVKQKFGTAGSADCTAGTVQLPYKMKIAWNTTQTISSFKCHKLVADSATRAFQKVADSYSKAEISDLGLDLFGGCYNYRVKRGGTTLSMHAYGLAIDIDPERNQLKWHKPQARLSLADAKKWFDAWYSEGWIGLGVEKDFDWMHVQAPKL